MYLCVMIAFRARSLLEQTTLELKLFALVRWYISSGYSIAQLATSRPLLGEWSGTQFQPSNSHFWVGNCSKIPQMTKVDI